EPGPTRLTASSEDARAVNPPPAAGDVLRTSGQMCSVCSGPTIQNGDDHDVAPASHSTPEDRVSGCSAEAAPAPEDLQTPQSAPAPAASGRPGRATVARR